MIARRLSQRWDLEAHLPLVHLLPDSPWAIGQSWQIRRLGKNLLKIHGRSGGCIPLASRCDRQSDGPPIEHKANPARSCSETTKLNGMQRQGSKIFWFFRSLLHAPGPRFFRWAVTRRTYTWLSPNDGKKAGGSYTQQGTSCRCIWYPLGERHWASDGLGERRQNILGRTKWRALMLFGWWLVDNSISAFWRA